MKFTISFVPSADEDLDFYTIREQRNMLDAIRELGIGDF